MSSAPRKLRQQVEADSGCSIVSMERDGRGHFKTTLADDKGNQIVIHLSATTPDDRRKRKNIKTQIRRVFRENMKHGENHGNPS